MFRGEVGVVGRDPTQDYYSANSAGYFIYGEQMLGFVGYISHHAPLPDLIVILAAYKYKLFNSSAMLIHHIYAGFGYIYIIVCARFPCILSPSLSLFPLKSFPMPAEPPHRLACCGVAGDGAVDSLCQLPLVSL